MQGQAYNEGKHRVFGVKTIPLENGKILIHSNLTNKSKTLTSSELQMILSCKIFNTLEKHAQKYYQTYKQIQLKSYKTLLGKFFRYLQEYANQENLELPIRNKETEQIRQKLQEWAEEGFLVSQQELRDKVIEIASGVEPRKDFQKSIRFLGIPTKNRRELLTRCVRSYLKNISKHDRSPVLHIVDDSDDESYVDRSRQTIAKICKEYQTELLWIDRELRHKLAAEMTKTTETPKDIARFALLGDSRCSLQTGSSRNTLLLLAAGQPSIQVDDDTQCKIISPPASEETLALSSQAESHRYWWDPNGSAFGKRHQEQIDYLGLHELFLGKQPGSLIQQHGEPDIQQLKGPLFKQIGRQETHNAISLVGAYGDSGMFRHWQRLCLEGDSFDRLVTNKSAYETSLRTRKFYRGVVQPTYITVHSVWQ
ncbi:hypothetical protein NC796_21875 [Aliifodinibius sp. S!AR15-10]|uniref:hypothetical protein n=1 Tax=Aliifodinibius sp. S!AR15-10 TaxID=2950437 RepID=UPI00285E8A36|nr:hypothetical protein [Aliifodinibius sp. S!AR15-10]MDR8393817.1 hypothetical protein [Aliifodinibius sp. S!AR15-10]